MTANPPEVAFILISSHEMEDAWRDLLLSSLAMVISWFETNFLIVYARFRCIGGGGAVVTGLLSAYALPGRGDLVAAEVTLVTAEVTLVAAEVTLTTTGRRSVLRLRADDGGRERHFCPISYNKVKKWANCKVNFDNYVYLCYCYHSRAQPECYGMTD
jgi:hypothetical protein